MAQQVKENLCGGRSREYLEDEKRERKLCVIKPRHHVSVMNIFYSFEQPPLRQKTVGSALKAFQWGQRSRCIKAGQNNGLPPFRLSFSPGN